MHGFRRLLPSDKPRVLEISAGVWEGEDYVPYVIDDWLGETDAELWGLLDGGELVCFARLDWSVPGFAWLEGIRTDQERRGQGYGHAMTRFLLQRALSAGAWRIALSNYRFNDASIRIVESAGFNRKASFTYLSAGPGDPVWARALASQWVETVGGDEATRFIARSAFLEAGRGYLPHGWHFYPFVRAPEVYLAQMRHLIGIRRDGRLRGLVCLGNPAHAGAASPVDFLDGEPETCTELLRHAMHLAGAAPSIALMIPHTSEPAPAALKAAMDLGVPSWNDYVEDVYVYAIQPEAGGVSATDA